MTTKHNKKRNTGFMYEALIRELTRAAVEGNSKRRVKLAKTIKESFSRETVLGKELDCYRALSETDSLDTNQAEKLVTTVKEAYGNLENSGVKKVEDGKATFWIHEPGQFQIPLKGVLPKCIHYRIIYDDDIVSSSINTMRLKKMS